MWVIEKIYHGPQQEVELASRLEGELEQTKSITKTILFWRCQFELATKQEHLYHVNNFGHPACPMQKNFGACRSSDRCLLECSSNYCLHHVGATIAQAPA